MRYSVVGLVGISALEDVMRQCVDDLANHDIDEVRGLSIYLAPRSKGRQVDFHANDGEVIDHIKLQPVTTRSYTGTSAVRRREPAERSEALVGIDMIAHASDVSRIMANWRLDLLQMAALMDSDQVRVARILLHELPMLLRRELERLSLLAEIDRYYEALDPDLPISEWLRSDAAMLAYSGAMPLEQLLSRGREALVRLRDALCALTPSAASSRAAISLGAGFDDILDRP
jgi:hypothetical protein